MKRITFKASLLMLALMVSLPTWAGTYVENFDDGNFDGWEIFDAGKPGSQWTVEDGVLTCRREIIWMSDLLFGEEDWRNYTIECDSRILEPLDETYGMALDLRVTYPEGDESKTNDVTCLASRSDKMATIWPWINGEFPDQKTSSDFPSSDFDCELGRWYRLKGVAHEDTFEFYLDGRLVASYTDDRIKTGRVGVMAAGASVLQFDNIIITGDDVPDNTDSLVEGDLLAMMYWFEEAWRSRNADLYFSIFTDDYISDWPPYPPKNKEETRPIAEYYMTTCPIYVLDGAFHKASAKDGVGFMEHTDTYLWPDNGVPVEEFHICLLDYDRPKPWKITVYLDSATSLIQAGVMPRRNLGDMVPSFPLPGPEATGLSPMEASAELLKRLNSHDLPNVAKMLRRDVDVWHSFIGLPTHRSQFIDIHEQFLGGFSDMSWENVRRVDMGDGWLFSEVKLRGTNDGKFLGKPATGLPMEVRAGLIEHYDENGLATYVHFHFDTLSVPGQAMPVDEIKDKMLALMQELEDGYNTHDSEKCASLFTDDAMVDMPPVPPYPGNGVAGFDALWEIVGPDFSLGNPIHLASSSDKVGVTEHSDLYSYPNTGTPMETPHLCVKDYNDELKAYKLTIYCDWADEYIQAGLMPPRNLGDLVPSFPLPEPEGKGLSPMEASAELMARLNSGDLLNTAKMIRKDGDVLFPFINRKATRSEFINIYERILGGFSDAHWEKMRRVDMGDGWVYFEGTLKGTNDGEFLGKAATGLPMEVRGGWVEHYDENGLATYLHAHFDSLSMPGQEAPTGPVEDFSNVFFLSLSEGLNMVSLPLRPQTSYNARSFADMLSATVVIKLDEARQRFVGFTLDAPDDGFDIEGGKGYIVNVKEGKTVAFTGATWTNKPPVEAAPTLVSDSAWAFVVSGVLSSPDDKTGWHGGTAPTDYAVQVRNLRTGDITTDLVSKSGYFALASADLSRKSIIQTGDKLEIIAKDASGNIVSRVVRTIDADNVGKAYLNVPLRLGEIIPSQTALLQNYPNPFNPETWIPFHLAQDADVSVRIYDAGGRLVRTLTLGHREAGIYVQKGKAVYWDGKSDSGEKVASGVYFYSIKAGDFSATRKLIVRK
ncbi:T9SS type A sorting domain-containing protein [Candidatus Poribacteria bacterium]|nr:T9SS type A sorting domain-containing protein [Candidatus Poribacteria bacterium]